MRYRTEKRSTPLIKKEGELGRYACVVEMQTMDSRYQGQI